MNIKIVNKMRGESGEYIGRPSPLGNPYPIDAEHDRDEVIRLYRDYLYKEVSSGNERILKELRRLYTKAKQGNLNLVCFCSPKKCHGDVIKEFLEQYM